MRNLKAETRYYTPELLELGLWLTEEEYRRIHSVIVCGPLASSASDPSFFELPDNEVLIADEILALSGAEYVSSSPENEVTYDHNLFICALPGSSLNSERSSDYKTLMTAEPSALSCEERIWKSSRSSEISEACSDTSYSDEASLEYSEDNSESNDGSTCYPVRNYMLEPYVVTPTPSPKRMRRRRLNLDDINSTQNSSDISDDENECDEMEAKRQALFEWINEDESDSEEFEAKRQALAEWISDIEQLCELRRPTCITTDDEK